MPFSKNPLLLPYDLICFVLGFIFWLSFIIMRFCCKIEYRGNILNSQSQIHAFWHQNLPLYFITHSKKKDQKLIWMQHPSWYMKTIHFLLWLFRIKIVYGSSGNNGEQALNKIIEYLKDGYSTSLNPDGPKGPPKQIKKGIINMSLLSGAPIQAVNFKCNYYFQIPSWDKKIFPLPFSKIIIEYPPHLQSQNFDFETLKKELKEQLV